MRVPWVTRWNPLAAVAALVAALGATHLWWLLRFRRGFPVDIDEAGYLWFAYTLHDRLRAEGVEGFLRGFQHEGWVAPLLPAVTAVLELPGGVGDIVTSMAVQIAFFAVLVFASYGIGERLLDRRAGLLTALVVGTVPAITDFVRTYHLVIPSTAMYALATYALLASDRLRSRWWTLAAGAALGLTLLSRSMMLAFIPALPLAAVWILIADRAERRRLINLTLGALAFVVVSLSWYATSWRPILDYLSSFGYGAKSASTGAELSPFSVGFWTHELTRAINGSVYLPLAAVLALALALALAGSVAARRRSDRPRRFGWIRRATRSDAIVPALVVVEGYLALTSSRNDGTGFVVPLLPSAVALAVLALLRIPWRGARLALVAAVAAVAVFNVVMKADVVSAASQPRTVDLPLFGSATLTNGRGWLHEHLVSSANYRLGPPTRWLPERERRWFPLYEAVARYVGGMSGSEPRVEVVPDEPLLNGSVLRLAAYRVDSSAIFEHGDIGGDDSVPAYRKFLRAERPDLLITTRPDGHQFPPRITSSLVESAARSLGFELRRRFLTPDGRALRIWAID